MEDNKNMNLEGDNNMSSTPEEENNVTEGCAAEVTEQERQNTEQTTVPPYQVNRAANWEYYASNAPQNPQPQSVPQAESGEYRYIPPFANVGANTPRPDPVYTPAPEPAKAPKVKKEKKKRSYSTAAIALMIAGCVLVSFAAGMGGALITDKYFTEDSTEASNDNNSNGININVAAPNDNAVFEGSYDLSDVCAAVSASVVEITTEFTKTASGYYQYVEEGAGSGVIISEDGYIVTNNHVITDASTGKRADAITVRLNSTEEYEAEIIGNDTDSDIALIKIKGDGFIAAKIGNSDSIKVGEQIIAVGNPLGELGGTVTTGIISATNRDISVENNRMTLIQIDAAINPGNSGGGLFNTRGELIGIVNAKTTDVTVEGLGFAIPVNEAISVCGELEENGYVTGKPYLGISLTDVTDSFTAYYYFRSESTGVYITMVEEGYNDDVLKYGDRITAINGEEVTSSADVKEAIKSSEVGDTLEFIVSRKGKLKTVEVECYEYVPHSDVSFDEE